MRIAITCKQLIRDFNEVADEFASASIEASLADVPGQHLAGEPLVAAVDGCIGVIAGDDQFTRDVLDSSPALRVIAKWGVGIDGIDLEAASERGIVVRNTPGMFNDEVADLAMAYLVDVHRHLTAIDREVRGGQWHQPPGRSLRGRTLGIVGLGGIGRALAIRAAASGMRRIGMDPAEGSRDAARELGVEMVDLDRLLAESDAICLTAPLNPKTRHLMDAEAFSKVRRGVRIVNVGRGALVDTEALIEALTAGAVAAAALDVLEIEPIPHDHPILRFPQVTVGAHNASNTVEASLRTHRAALQQLVGALRSIR